MSSNAEEQEMEAQALEAIYDQAFTMISQTEWTIEIYPEPTNNYDDNDESLSNNNVNHVGCMLVISLPETYPELSIPVCTIKLLKGLVDEHKLLLETIVNDECTNLIGTPSIFSIVEKVREWLVNNNVKGLDDISMHAVMMRKEREKQEQLTRTSQQQQFQSTIGTVYESHHQSTEMEMTEAEMEEYIVTKRRAEGTPCNKENFSIWITQFDNEMSLQSTTTSTQPTTTTTAGQSQQSKTGPVIDKTGRLTGYQYFSDKSNNYEALEAAAERAEMEYNNSKSNDNDKDEAAIGGSNSLDAELFDDDVDVDDLSFDDEEEEDDDDDDDDEEEEEDDDVNI